MLLLAGCTAADPTVAPSPLTMASASPAAVVSADPSIASAEPSIQDVMTLGRFADLKPGTYSIDPDGDATTPLRVVYDIPAAGWSMWIGAAKSSDAGNTGVSITTVSNLVTDGCTDHAWREPPIGPTVDDLATALTELAPFEVTSPPSEVTLAGYDGKHLAWTVPELPVEAAGDDTRFIDCHNGQLKSWVAFIDADQPGDAFYGYTGPGYVEDFWILDVDGTRLMIAAEQSAGSPAADVAEQDAIVESIRIEP
jgi:hypothetical protein